MYTEMWDDPITRYHLKLISERFNLTVVEPLEKRLACGDIGRGGLANIDDIIKATMEAP